MLSLSLAPAALASEHEDTFSAVTSESNEAAIETDEAPSAQEGSDTEEDGLIVKPPEDAPSAWAAAEVSAAIEAGLVPENLQKSYQKDVTRGAVANIFINLIEQASGMSIAMLMAEKGVETDPGAFTDTDDPAVLAANALGIIHGIGDGRFDPGGILQRHK